MPDDDDPAVAAAHAEWLRHVDMPNLSGMSCTDARVHHAARTSRSHRLRFRGPPREHSLPFFSKLLGRGGDDSSKRSVDPPPGVERMQKEKLMVTSGVCTRAPRAVTVLFVDDDADARSAYRLLGTEEGMIVELARDGHEAIALACVLLPEVIVLDVELRSLDGLNGLEVARRLRASSCTSTIPILFLSGYSSEQYIAAMRAAGCEGYLVKPCSAERLLGLVTALAMSRRSEASGGVARALIA